MTSIDTHIEIRSLDSDPSYQHEVGAVLANPEAGTAVEGLRSVVLNQVEVKAVALDSVSKIDPETESEAAWGRRFGKIDPRVDWRLKRLAQGGYRMAAGSTRDPDAVVAKQSDQAWSSPERIKVLGRRPDLQRRNRSGSWL